MKITKIVFFVLIATIGLRNGVAHAALGPAYQIVDLGTLGGTSSYARGINASGQIVGYSYLPGDSFYHAFVYTNGTMTDLGTLGGKSSQAYGINDNGIIVGTANTSAGGGTAATHAFSLSAGHMSDLGTLGGGEQLRVRREQHWPDFRRFGNRRKKTTIRFGTRFYIAVVHSLIWEPLALTPTATTMESTIVVLSLEVCTMSGSGTMPTCMREGR